jgi:hypothetical protein
MANRYWVGGSASWDATAGTKWALTSGGAGGQAVPTAADDVFIDSGSGVVTVTVAAAAVCRNLSFTSGSGNFAGTFAGTSTLAISGDLTLVFGMTRTYTGTITFNSTTTQTITSNTKTLDSPITFNGVGGNWTIADDFATGAARLTTLTNGTISITAAKKFSTGLFASSNTNARGITFNTGSYVELTGVSTAGTITIWDTSNATNMTYTGTNDVRLTGNSTANLRALANGITAGGSAATAVSFTISAGSDTIFSSNNTHFNNLIFTSYTGTLDNHTRNIYGDVTFSSGMTVSGSAVQSFISTSKTQTITTNGVTYDFPININAPSSTIVFADNFTQGTSRIFTLTTGTLNINGKTVSFGNFYSYGALARALTFGTSGKIIISSGGVNAWSVDGSNLTTTGTNATISMASASTKTFAGNGYNYAATLSQDGLGALTITGSNTFANITNTVQPTTVTFTAGTTQTVSSFTASGTAGNLVTLQSSSAGSRFTLSNSSGTNSVSYCSIKDSVATGGAYWQSLTSNGNVDAGNNAGWIFSAIPVIYEQASNIKLRSLAQRGRF